MKRDVKVDQLVEKINLIEKHVAAKAGPYGPDKHTKAQMQEWVQQMRDAVNSNKSQEYKDAESQVNDRMKQLEIETAVKKPVNKATEAIRRGTSAIRRMSQGGKSESPVATPDASPNLSRVSEGPKPYKVTEEELKTIIQLEKKVSGQMENLKKINLLDKLDPKLKEFIDRSVQGTYAFEIRLNSGKPVDPEMPGKIKKTLSEIDNYLTTFENDNKAIQAQQSEVKDASQAQQITAANVSELDKAPPLTTEKKSWASAAVAKSSAERSASVTLGQKPEKAQKSDNLSEASQIELDNMMKAIFQSDATSPQKSSPQEKEPRNAAKASVPVSPPESPKTRIKLVGLKKMYQQKAAAEEQKSAASPEQKQADSSPLIQRLRSESHSNEGNAASSPKAEKGSTHDEKPTVRKSFGNG